MELRHPSHAGHAGRPNAPRCLFIELTLGYTRDPSPANTPVETVRLATAGGQQMQIVHLEGFAVSPFEGEFGRHIAIFPPGSGNCRAERAAAGHRRPPDATFARRHERTLLLPRAGKRLRVRGDRADVTRSREPLIGVGIGKYCPGAHGPSQIYNWFRPGSRATRPEEGSCH
jgi:hypothetical protein